MTANPLHLVDTGLEIYDIREDEAFAARKINHRDAEHQTLGMQRLVRAILHEDKSVLQELVDIAVELCGADSAAISLVQPGAPEAAHYRWIATAGRCSNFLNRTLPRYPSACGVAHERGGPQHFCLHARFYEILGIETNSYVSDGIVIPWHVDGIHGTIFIMAFDRPEAFDLRDCRMMELLADFAALAIRQRRHQNAFLQQAAQTAAAMNATQIEKVSNPMQSLIHMLYLSEAGIPRPGNHAPQHYIPRPGDELPSLSALATRLLAIPYHGIEQH